MNFLSGGATTLKFIVSTPVSSSCAQNSLEHGRVTRQLDIDETIPCGWQRHVYDVLGRNVAAIAGTFTRENLL